MAQESRLRHLFRHFSPSDEQRPQKLRPRSEFRKQVSPVRTNRTEPLFLSACRLLDNGLPLGRSSPLESRKDTDMTQLFIAVQTFFATRRDDERGATAVEYGLIVALIAAVIVTVVGTLGGQIDHAFQTVVDALPAAG